MALPIIEQPLYGQIALETTAWSTPFSWVDRTADLVNGVGYSEGGRIGVPGSSPVDVGTLIATFKNLATVPVVGDLVRLRRAGTTEYAFTGYVQDVSQRIVFDSSVSYTTPITLTTINCVDWVGYISQFQAVGVGGANTSTGVAETDSVYQWTERIAALNKVVDSAFTTKIIRTTGSGGSGQFLGDTDLIGSIAQHLDLITPSSNIIWYGSHELPTNKTTGRTSLIDVTALASLSSSGKTFTDEAGTAGQLHYIEIDFENSTQNVANTIVLNNRARFYVPNVEVTKVGGFNEENFMLIDNTTTVGVAVDREWQETDSTSVTSYGNRQAVFDTNIAMGASNVNSHNLIINPSVEYSDDGYSAGANSKVRRRKPSEDTNPFTAYTGSWSMRSRQTVAAANAQITFSGGESDGIPVVAAQNYYFKAQALRGTVSRTDVRAQTRVNWYDDAEAQIGATVSGANVSLTTANTWYQLTSGSITAPAGAVRATVQVFYTRTGGGNHSVGDLLWADGLQFAKADNAYFDGDTAWTSSYGYIWTGGVGASPSYQIANWIDNVALSLLSTYSTTSNRVTRIRWNAQEDLTAVSSLSVGKTVSIRYDGTTTTYRIVGIDGTIDPERYMIDYYVQKV